MNKKNNLSDILFKKHDKDTKPASYDYDLVLKENKTQIPILSFRVDSLKLKADPDGLRVRMHKALDLVLDSLLEKFK